MVALDQQEGTIAAVIGDAGQGRVWDLLLIPGSQVAPLLRLYIVGKGPHGTVLELQPSWRRIAHLPVLAGWKNGHDAELRIVDAGAEHRKGLVEGARHGPAVGVRLRPWIIEESFSAATAIGVDKEIVAGVVDEHPGLTTAPGIPRSRCRETVRGNVVGLERVGADAGPAVAAGGPEDIAHRIEAVAAGAAGGHARLAIVPVERSPDVVGATEAVSADLHIEQPDLVIVTVVVQRGEHGASAAPEHDQAVVDRVKGEVHAPLGRH